MSERECYCDSRQCDICTPDAPRGVHAEMTGDLKAAIQMLAADNARLCEIVQAADEIVKYLDGIGLVKYAGHRGLERLLDAFRIKRNGQ